MSTQTAALHALLPWTSVANSWQYTTIYDVDGEPVCRFDLENWGVTEDNQAELELRQADVVARTLRAVNCFDDMLAALREVVAISSNGHDTISFLTELHRVSVVCAVAIAKATTP